MIHIENKNFSAPFTVFVWLLMSFQAGYVNAGALFISGNFVSHVTGTASQIGIGLANWDVVTLITFITIILAFIFGAAFSGYFISGANDKDKKANYTFVLLSKAILFGVVLFLSYWETTTYGGYNEDTMSWLIIFCLSFCCGMQNATCSQATSGQLKPTHMTGLSTDIGLFFGRFLASGSKLDKDFLSSSVRRLWVLFSFIFGGIMATFIFIENGPYGLLFPFLSSIGFFAISILAQAKESRWNVPALMVARGSIVVTFIGTIAAGLVAVVPA